MAGILRLFEGRGDRTVIGQGRKATFRFAASFIEQNAKVLDIGCGSGEFADLLGKEDIHLMDWNEETVRTLRKRWMNVYCASLPDVPFPPDSFDVIHCSHVMEHLQPESVHQALCNMDRCLCDGGVLILSFPLLHSGFYDDLSHVKPYNSQVFLHYLVKSSNRSRTRQLIRGSYALIDQMYRYKVKPPPTLYVQTKGIQGLILRKILRLVEVVFCHISICLVEKSGEVLVLKKVGQE